MNSYIIKRILLLIPVLLGVTFIVFSIMSLTPGDPGRLILGESATVDAVDQLNHELGFDKPFIIRYIDYVTKAITGDFGESYRTGKPVFIEIFNRFPTSLTLAVGAITLAIIIGMSIGILSAVKQYSLIDIISIFLAMFMASIPQFWFGLIIMLFFSLKLGWLPSVGIGSINHFIMPIVTLSLPCAANILRLTRSTMLDTIRKDYIRTARAKGAKERAIIWKHSLKNALLPIITIIGINFGYLMGGTILVESIFGIPGLGTLTITSIRMKDIPQTTASVLFLASLYCVIMLLVDILYFYIDPRIRARYVRYKGVAK